MNLEYRLAILDDLERLAEINSLGSEEGRILARKELPRFIEAGNLICAISDSEIVGLCYWQEKFFGNDDFWFLTQVTVDERFRRQGIGEQIWKYFIEFTKDKGIRKIFADIPVSNEASLNLVKKIGAAEAGRIDLGDGDERLYFRIDL